VKKWLKYIAVLIGAMGIATDVAAMPKNNSSRTPLLTPNKERAMGICFGVIYNSSSQQYVASGVGLAPEFSATGYFTLYEKLSINEPPSNNIELVQQPKHGKLVYSKYEDGSLKRGYIPDLNYVGDDKLIFQANVDGKIVKLVYILKVTKVVTGGQITDEVFCKKTGTQWKISEQNLPVSIAAIQSLIDSSGINSAINVNVVDLPGGALGQTIGNARS
jgi:hypothetical protein